MEITPTLVVTGHVHIACKKPLLLLSHNQFLEGHVSYSRLYFIQMNNYGTVNKLVLCSLDTITYEGFDTQQALMGYFDVKLYMRLNPAC